MFRLVNPLSPSRLRVARKLRGYTKKDLAVATRVSQRSLSAYETGRQNPGLGTLEDLSRVLSVPVGFLTAPEITELPDEAISFRALSRLPAKIRHRATATAALAVQVAQWMDDRFDLPVVDLPDWELVDPEAAADGLRAAWGLGLTPAPNLMHLLEAHGVCLFSVATLAEGQRGLDGLSFWCAGVPYILVNTFQPASRVRMSVAHELGHLLLHHGSGLTPRKTAERDATRFGSAFLLPRSSLLACGVTTPSMDRLLELKGEWNVSLAAITYRLHEIKLLSDWAYRTAFVEINQKGMRYEESHEPAVESSQVLHQVFSARRTRGTARCDLARDLHLPRDDLDALLMGLVPTALPDPHSPDHPPHGYPATG